MTAKATFIYRDNTGKVAEHSANVETDGTKAAADAKMLALAAAFASISNALIVQATYTVDLGIAEGTGPAANTPIRQGGLVFFRDSAGVIRTLRIPATSLAAYVEQSGPYAGRRVTRAGAGPVLIAALDTIGMLTLHEPEGVPLGEFVLAAIERVQE